VVVVPYVTGAAPDGHLAGPQAETLAALAADGIQPQLVAIDASDATGYHRAVAALWAAGETFVIVEQDIVPFPGAIAELATCERDWCAFPYELQVGIQPALGCTKFSARLMARFPDALSRAGEPDQEGLPAKDWRRLDVRLDRVLRGYGAALHVHAGVVGHLNPSQRLVSLH